MKISLWAEIHRLHGRERLSARSIARLLHLSRDTVKKALDHPDLPPPDRALRGSILDPYKAQVDKLIAGCQDLSAVRVLEELAKKGYRGEITLVRNYLREIRPARGRVYQEVEYAPGRAMQIDWGSCGTVPVGTVVRKVSVFVAVLCFSRLIYIEFSLNQSKAHFYRCFARALSFFGGAVEIVIVDNFRTAVAAGSGRNARFQGEFIEFCAYHRLEPVACEKADPETKGVVEGGIRYVKRNALAGRREELTYFQAYQKLAVYWRDEVANVRKHGTTGERPVDRFEKERHLLRPLPAIPYDTDDVIPTVVTPFARVQFDTNRYSVPPQYAKKAVTLRVDDKSVRVFHRGEEVAHHKRSFERKKLIIDPEHQKAALAMRKRTHAQKIEVEFDALGPQAQAFRRGLLSVPVKPIVHLRRVLGLVRLYGRTPVLEALGRAVELGTFDAAYVVNLIDQDRRRRQLPSPTPLAPQRRELLEEIDLEEPDPAEYDALLDLEGGEL